MISMTKISENDLSKTKGFECTVVDQLFHNNVERCVRNLVRAEQHKRVAQEKR